MLEKIIIITLNLVNKIVKSAGIFFNYFSLNVYNFF